MTETSTAADVPSTTTEGISSRLVLILAIACGIAVANLYYAAMHFPGMFVFLIWLFWWHRDEYRPVRQVLGWTTLVCLIVQLVPVAPPRFLPGIVDTGKLYNQSVY